MLVLSRKQKQQIRIGDDVTITILKIKGQSIRIGIEAPRGVRVLRGELRRFEGEDSMSFEVEDLSLDESSASVDWASSPRLPEAGRGLRSAMDSMQPASLPGVESSAWRSEESSGAPLAGRISRTHRDNLSSRQGRGQG